MQCLSDGGHAVGEAVQAPRVQTQTSVSHVAAKRKTHTTKHVTYSHHEAAVRHAIKGLGEDDWKPCRTTLCLKALAGGNTLFFFSELLLLYTEEEEATSI